MMFTPKSAVSTSCIFQTVTHEVFKRYLSLLSIFIFMFLFAFANHFRALLKPSDLCFLKRVEIRITTLFKEKIKRVIQFFCNISEQMKFDPKLKKIFFTKSDQGLRFNLIQRLPLKVIMINNQ